MAPQIGRKYGLRYGAALDVLRELNLRYGIGTGYDLIDNRGRNNRTHIVNSDGPICTIELFYHEDEGGKNVVDKVLIETREFREEYKKCAAIFDDRIIENRNILRKPDGYPQYRYWLDFSECDYDMSTGEKLEKAICDMYLLATSFENNYEMVIEDLGIADE